MQKNRCYLVSDFIVYTCILCILSCMIWLFTHNPDMKLMNSVFDANFDEISLKAPVVLLYTNLSLTV